MGKAVPTKVPVMKKNQPYEDWMKRIQVWKATNTVLGVEKKIQAGVLFESLKGNPQQIVLSELKVAEIIADDGIKNITDTLDNFFMPNKVESAFNALNDLFTYKCEKGVSTESFIVEFQLKVNKVKASGTTLSENLLGYTLLNCANLSEEKLDIVKATCNELTYKNVKSQLIKVGREKPNTNKNVHTSTIQIEDCFYTSKFPKKKSLSQNSSHCANAEKKWFFTKPSCRKSKFSRHNNAKQLDDTLYNKVGVTLYINSDSVQLCSLAEETLGQALVDTASPYTVAGDMWFECYLDSLSRRDRSSIHLNKSNKRFCFGDGRIYNSKYHTTIPIYIQQCKYYLGVDIVSCNIPLLLSRSTLCRADAKIDIGSSTISILGVTSPLVTSSSGHLCLSISRSLDTTNDDSTRLVSNVLFSSPEYGCDVKNKANKLHKQFSHPTADCLIDFIRKTGLCDQYLERAITEVTSLCEVCVKIKRREVNQDTLQLYRSDDFLSSSALETKSPSQR